MVGLFDGGRIRPACYNYNHCTTTTMTLTIVPILILCPLQYRPLGLKKNGKGRRSEVLLLRLRNGTTTTDEDDQNRIRAFSTNEETKYRLQEIFSHVRPIRNYKEPNFPTIFVQPFTNYSYYSPNRKKIHAIHQLEIYFLHQTISSYYLPPP